MENTRYFVILDYNGAPYHGWQVQPNSDSVQGTLNNAFSLILREPIYLTGAGRTDTGVHARNFVAHFEALSPDLHEQPDLIRKLNRFLPREIVVHRIAKVHPDAHSRFDATSRTYRYKISKVKSPFDFYFSYYLFSPLDMKAMQQATEKLFQYTDFTSFSKVDTDVKTNDCKIMEARWNETPDELIFTIKADRFLRNMVRAIVGTLIEVGQHKLTVEEFCRVIEAKDRGKAGTSAPAHALMLVQIDYPYLF